VNQWGESDGERARRRKGERANKLGTASDTSENNIMKSIRHFRDLDVYQGAMALVMRVFELAKNFPSEERYALTDQIRRSSRSVCANLAEAWRKRRYQAAFVSKLNDAEAEAVRPKSTLRSLFGMTTSAGRPSKNSMMLTTKF
jgi:hypothetical protein